MMDKILYPHIKKLIELQEINKNKPFFMFPKLDGSNCRISKNFFGTKNTIINEKSDFKSFIKNVKVQILNLNEFFEEFPNIILFGEYIWNNKRIKYKSINKFLVFDSEKKSYLSKNR